MPNVIINEYDLSTTGVAAYANFSVVVPGFVKNTEKYAEVADSSGVFECSTQADFIKYVGKLSQRYDPKGPDFYENVEYGWSGNQNTITAANLDLALEYFRNNQLYIAVEASSPAVGYLHDKQYKYERAVVEPSVSSSVEIFYAIITPGNEGTDGELHYGNQIAYELLGLGYTVLYKKLETIADITDSESIIAFLEPLKDKSVYQFRYILTGLLENNTIANNAIAQLATYINNADYTTSGRGDIIALLDISKINYAPSSATTLSQTIANINADISKISDSNKFSSFFAPYVSLDIKDEYYENTVFPGSFYYLACAANAFGNLGYNEWWPVAGYERGVSKYTILQTGYNFGELAADLLQPRNGNGNIKKAVNLIIKSHNNYYLYGNRTANAIGDELKFSDFLNIRQLLATLKKQTYYACKKFTFDPNSSLLWIKFCDAIEPTLKRMKADEGVEDYKFVKVNTKLKATMKGLIRIVPIEGVEDFKIGINMEDSIKGVAVNMDELE